jgi:solute carrier family 13 (sodium-dependent dicarboxylate transporter), member 2/3/5
MADQPPPAPRRTVLGLLAAVVLPGLLMLLPAPAGLSGPGQRMAALFLAALILWATEALPVAVTALLAVLLQPVLRVEEVRTAFASFMSPVFFFVLAMFFLAAALMASGVDRRFALVLLARAGTRPRRVLLALMAGTAALSTIMSDVPVCAIFMAVALGIFARANVVPGSPFGKSVMMGIPIASLIGGVATPAGSAINILGIYFIEEYGKVRVPFLSWTAIGVPMVLVLLPVAWWVLCRFHPPEMEAVGSHEEVRAELLALGRWTMAEKKVVALLAVLVVAWVTSTWVKALDVTLVALAGSLALFLPGLRLLKWEDAQRKVGWDALLMIGGVTSLGAASVKTGLAKWMVGAVLGGMSGWSAVWVIAAISAFTVVVHLAIPIAPVINSVLIPPIVLLAVSAGQSPALYALPVAFTASCAFLLPLDAVPLVTLPCGYYRTFDMFAPGVVISVVWVVWMTVLMMLLGPALHLF